MRVIGLAGLAALVMATAACGPTGGDGSNASAATPTPTPSSSAAPSPAGAASPSATASPQSQDNSVTFSGDRTGSLTNLRPQCANQYPGVQTDGDLNGTPFELTVADPASSIQGGNITLYQKAADGVNNDGVWQGGSPGVSDYSSTGGANFDAVLQPVSGPQAHSSIRVTGVISC